MSSDPKIQVKDLKGVNVEDEIAYYCMVHSSMIGKLVIDAAAAASTSGTPSSYSQ
jgi:hypothetical protein